MTAVRRPAGLSPSRRLLLALAVTTLGAMAMGAAPAAAEPVGNVTVDGQNPSQTGLRVSVSLQPDPDNPGGRLLVVKNTTPDTPDTHNQLITDVRGNVDPASGGFAVDGVSVDDPPEGEQEMCDTPFGGDSNAFQCGTGVAEVGPGSDVRIHIRFTDPGWSGGLSSVDVITNGGVIGDCVVRRAADARIADKCTPPSHTQITRATINSGKHTAFFTFKARHATGFRCSLIRSRQVLVSGSCRYFSATQLRPGRYTFFVRGTNRAGWDRKAAVKKFTIA